MSTPPSSTTLIFRRDPPKRRGRDRCSVPETRIGDWGGQWSGFRKEWQERNGLLPKTKAPRGRAPGGSHLGQVFEENLYEIAKGALDPNNRLMTSYEAYNQIRGNLAEWAGGAKLIRGFEKVIDKLCRDKMVQNRDNVYLITGEEINTHRVVRNETGTHRYRIGDYYVVEKIDGEAVILCEIEVKNTIDRYLDAVFQTSRRIKRFFGEHPSITTPALGYKMKTRLHENLIRILFVGESEEKIEEWKKGRYPTDGLVNFNYIFSFGA